MSKDELRPTSWDGYIGQASLKRRIRIHAMAALREMRTLEPTLLAAPAGYGKTSLAELIAKEMHDDILISTMPMSPTQMQSVVRMHEGCWVLDEAHRLSKKAQEDLLPLLEFGHLDMGGRKLSNPTLSIIATTTEPESLIEPLYDRFVIKPTYDDYSEEEMAMILERMLETAYPVDERVYDLPEGFTQRLSVAALGTPRRCRQFALAARDLHAIGEDVTVESVLDLTDVGYDGLTKDHLQYLDTLASLGGARGVDVIANLMRVSRKQITQLERVLLQHELITIFNSRELTRKGVNRLREAGKNYE